MSILAVFTLLNLSVFAQETVQYDFSGIGSVSIGGSFSKVILKQGDKEGVVVRAAQKDLDNIEIKMKDNDLKIGAKRGMYNSAGRVEIEVTYKSIAAINNSGSSSIVLEGTLKSDKFTVSTSGSGDLSGDIDVKALSVRISGSSDMSLSGTADAQVYAISGSGDIDASKLKGETAEVAISGSGDVALNVSGKVSKAVSGSGEVTNQSRKN